MCRRHALNGGTCLKCHQTWSTWLTLVCVSFLKRTFEPRCSSSYIYDARMNRRSSIPICSTSVMVKVKMNVSSEPLWWKSPILSLFIDIHRKFIENHRKIDFRWILWKFQNWSRILNPTLRSGVMAPPPFWGGWGCWRLIVRLRCPKTAIPWGGPLVFSGDEMMIGRFRWNSPVNFTKIHKF